MSFLARARYVASAHDVPEFPADTGHEVAFAGRSNAGKSSAINVLARQTRLAFTSKTPGRTQLINFFALGEARFLVDLPGYGFAKVPASERAHWDRLIGTYLLHRDALRGLVVLMDVRHPMTPLDVQLLDWFAPTGKPVHVLLTKADKLSRQQQQAQLASVRASFAGRVATTAQLFSSLARQGLDEAEAVLAGWLDWPLPEPEKERPPAQTGPRRGSSLS
jgi:GTP-binding protein